MKDIMTIEEIVKEISNKRVPKRINNYDILAVYESGGPNIYGQLCLRAYDSSTMDIKSHELRCYIPFEDPTHYVKMKDATQTIMGYIENHCDEMLLEMIVFINQNS